VTLSLFKSFAGRSYMDIAEVDGEIYLSDDYYAELGDQFRRSI